MRSLLFYLLLLVGVFLIFYLSWVSDPDLRKLGFLPAWLTDWTDAEENATIRTGVPFLFISILLGIRGIILNANLKWWSMAFAFLVLIVVISEFVQSLLPFRHNDVKDILWGTAGSFAGLLPTYLYLRLKSTINKMKR